ncbi:bone morphogenetic protein 1-like [Ptychodera flava]|uniref:bone morphogenetic protein 1-like n=1 Tax=Ptychodera flava TaxID=63121 RepID=UPI00396A778B
MMGLKAAPVAAMLFAVVCVRAANLSGGTLTDNHHNIEKKALGECGGIFYDDFGQISSPGYPSFYGTKQDCTYIILADISDAQIFLYFRMFHLEPIYDVVKIYDGVSFSGTLIGEYSGDSIPDLVTSTTSALTLTFSSDFSANGPGFLAGYVTSSKENPCNRVMMGDYGSAPWLRPWSTLEDMTCFLLIIASPGKAMQAKVSVEFHGYNVSVTAYDGQCDSGVFLGTESFVDYYEPPIYTRSTGQMLCVQIHSRYAPDVYVEYTSTEQGFSEFYQDFGWQTDSGGHFAWTTDISSYMYALGECGGDLSLNSGSFASPSYPEAYQNQQDCYYTVTVSSGNIVVLEFTMFDTEPCCDFVEVFDGNSKTADTSLGRYYGSKIDSEIKSSGRSLFVHFHSDHSETRKGFYASFSTDQTRNIWVIVGCVVGAFVLLALVSAVAIIHILVKKKKKKSTTRLTKPIDRPKLSMRDPIPEPDATAKTHPESVDAGETNRNATNTPSAIESPSPNIPGSLEDIFSP